MSESTEFYIPEFHSKSYLNKFSLKGTMTVGRSAADIVIDDKMLSSKHCQFKISGLVVSVIDLGSKNGTFVNGEKLTLNEERKLNIGDRVRIGSHEYIFNDHDTDLNVAQNVPGTFETKNSFEFKFFMLFNFFEANFFMCFLFSFFFCFYYCGSAYLFFTFSTKIFTSRT